ncbi:MAG: magnesium chelatase subunit H [Gemmatimonadaceae bacterium]|nr:magnesium chelatase subunit H [Gemmatimonadaceae bacterium]
MPPLRFVIITLDSHLAGAVAEASAIVLRQVPSIDLRVHVAADWPGDPAALERCRSDIATGDIIAVTQCFQDEQVTAIRDALLARREHCDAMLVAVSAPELVRCTRMGRFDLGGAEEKKPKPWSPLGILKRLRGSRSDGKSSGERQMTALKAMPALLKFIPGPAQDVRVYLLSIQYWLAGTSENIANLILLHVEKYADGPRKVLRARVRTQAPKVYPEVGLWHPDVRGEHGITEALSALPKQGPAGTVGVLLGRSYLLADNVAHYAAVVRAFEQRGLRTIPAFASALDARPAIERYFVDGAGRATVDAVVSLTGFSLVGGPAYNDAEAAQATLGALDVPYFCLQTLEFQSTPEWRDDPRGLNPLQATLQVAIPELDGAIGPTVFAGKVGAAKGVENAESRPITERVGTMADRVARMVRMRRTARADRKVAVVLFNFPPNAGNTGSAAYLDCFHSLYNTMLAMRDAGYTVTVPASVDALRDAVTQGNREQYGSVASVFARVPTDDHVRRERYLPQIEGAWGPAPGRQFADGHGIQILGAEFGNVFVGVQPSFGWEGDPMRLLFEGNFAPTHAFSAFYRWLREDWGAHVALHFGTHGALEFMPGKQAGLTDQCWPDRLIGDLPNVYLYASNNSSEGTLAKRRGGATTLISYLTPSLSSAGLYKGLVDLKATYERWRNTDDRTSEAELLSLVALLQEQACAMELTPATPAWTPADRALIESVRQKLIEVEQALIPVGLHVVGRTPTVEERADMLAAIASVGRPEANIAAFAETVRAAARRALDPEALDAVAREIVTAAIGAGEVAAGLRAAERLGVSPIGLEPTLQGLMALDALLAVDAEIPGMLRALDGRFVAAAPAADLVRNAAVLPTGRNLYGFDPYKVPSPYALKEGAARAEQLIARHVADGNAFPETVAFVLWGTDNMKSEGTQLAQVLALMGVVPRFDGVGRLCGARLLPLAQLGRPRVDVVASLSGIFRDLLPLQVKLLAEAALLCAAAEEPEAQNFIRKHALAAMREDGVDLETASLRVFGNSEGSYGSNVNLLLETGRWEDENQLADLFVQRKGFAYGADGKCRQGQQMMKRALGTASLSFQNVDSAELGATDIDQYVEALGGVNRVIEQQQQRKVACYMGDHTGKDGKIRTLEEQVVLESRTRALNPKWYEGQLVHGYEGVRNIAGHIATTVGWSSTTGSVPGWVYGDMAQTFVLDAEMRDRLASLNPSAAAGMATKLLEANDRGYWSPDAATLDALRDAAAELEDRLEGVVAR